MSVRVRSPYVGDGIEGARRSAHMDREEADTLPTDDRRHIALLVSALRWERQAEGFREAIAALQNARQLNATEEETVERVVRAYLRRVDVA